MNVGLCVHNYGKPGTGEYSSDAQAKSLTTGFKKNSRSGDS